MLARIEYGQAVFAMKHGVNNSGFYARADMGRG